MSEASTQRVNEVVYAALQRVAQERAIPTERIKAHHTLVEDIGFRSLDLARLIAIIELELDADPFASLVPVTSVRTVADLCAAYAKCFAPTPEPARSDATAEDPASRPSAAVRRAPQQSRQKGLRKRARDGID